MRVRLPRIDDQDLNLFEFDYDLTFMVFFLDAEGHVYARYGGRDASGPDSRHSLAGLRFTMQSVLREHHRATKEFAPRSQDAPRILGRADRRGAGGCMHCHQVKEALDADLHKAGKWTRERVWRYPPPENVGIGLEVERGNVVNEVKVSTPAAAVGLKAGDVLSRLNGVPTHSFADVQLGLDRAPPGGTVGVTWRRDGADCEGKLHLSAGWKRTDISWRASAQGAVPSARLGGTDLTPDEKKTLGLPVGRLAFRQKHPLSAQAQAAGVLEGDVILGIDGKQLDTDRLGLHDYVRSHYLVGDRVTVNLLRNGMRLDVSMIFVR